MKLWQYRMRQSGRYFQLDDKVLREPGYTLQNKREEVWDKVSQYFFLLPVYPDHNIHHIFTTTGSGSQRIVVWVKHSNVKCYFRA